MGKFVHEYADPQRYSSNEAIVDKKRLYRKIHYDNKYGLRMNMPVKNELTDSLIL